MSRNTLERLFWSQYGDLRVARVDHRGVAEDVDVHVLERERRDRVAARSAAPIHCSRVIGSGYRWIAVKRKPSATSSSSRSMSRDCSAAIHSCSSRAELLARSASLIARGYSISSRRSAAPWRRPRGAGRPRRGTAGTPRAAPWPGPPIRATSRRRASARPAGARGPRRARVAARHAGATARTAALAHSLPQSRQRPPTTTAPADQRGVSSPAQPRRRPGGGGGQALPAPDRTRQASGSARPPPPVGERSDRHATPARGAPREGSVRGLASQERRSAAHYPPS